MNRQARIYGCISWFGFGDVTFEQAAKRLAMECPFGSEAETIQVRDESEPEIIYTLTVERVVEYRVTNLRGGE
jgi:hypothetical protein